MGAVPKPDLSSNVPKLAAALAGLVLATALLLHIRGDGWIAGLSPAVLEEGRMERLLSSHQFFLPPAAVQRGQAYHGSGERLRAFASKLLAGQPVHVVIVGGSISYGTWVPRGTEYAARFFAWLNATFPAVPPAAHRLTNAARPAHSSATFALCSKHLVPQDPDLIVIEFNVNDNYPGLQNGITSSPRLAYEQLVRRMLRLPSSPAIIAMHAFAWWISKPGDNSSSQPPSTPALFYKSGEDDLAVIAQFYDLPILSVRNAVYRHMLANAPGFKVDIARPATLNKSAAAEYFYVDRVHPSGSTGHRAMADLLVAAVQHAVADTLMHQANLAAGTSSQPSGERALAALLPPPMLPGNWEPADPTCLMGAAIQAAVLNSSGFKWQAQVPDAKDATGQKWGLTGTAPGDWAVLQLNTWLQTEAEASDQAAPARLYLAHVRSWQERGSASVTCVGGCTCNATTLRNHWSRKNTQTALFAMEVTQHRQCRLNITINAQLPGATLPPTTILSGAMVSAASSMDLTAIDLYDQAQWELR